MNLFRTASLFFLFSSLTSAFAQTLVAPPPAQPPVTPRPLLTAYFPQWGIYNQPEYTVKSLLVSGGASLLDQMNYAQAFVTGGKCSVADPNADLNYTFTAGQSVDGIADRSDQPFRGNLHQLVKLKQQLPRLKLIISLEGRASDFAFDAQPENRDAFIDSCVDMFLRGHLAPGIEAPGLFDGIDIDWEYPHQEDASNYLALLTELRTRMDALRPGLLLNIAVGPSPRMYPGINMAVVARIVNQIGLMTYDFNGPWSTTTGFLSPLISASADQGGSITRSVQSYLAAGVPASQLLVGLPFYGYGWRQVPDDNNGLFQEGQAIRGDRPYRAIADLVPQSTLYRDELSQAPWLFDGNVFWTYDDPVSIRRKAGYILHQQLGGFMVWELGEDTSAATLLHAAHNGLTQPFTQISEPAHASSSALKLTAPSIVATQ